MVDEEKKDDSSEENNVTEKSEKSEEKDSSNDNAEDKDKEKKEDESNESSGQKPEKETDGPKDKPTQKPKEKVKVSGKLADIIKDIENLSVLELSDLVKALEDKFGVSAVAPVAVATSPVGDADKEGDTEEGKTSFNVILTEGGSNKIGAIKAVRELVPSLGLKEAKDLVDAAPKQVLEGAGKDAANEAKQKLEAVGAKVELQ